MDIDSNDGRPMARIRAPAQPSRDQGRNSADYRFAVSSARPPPYQRPAVAQSPPFVLTCFLCFLALLCRSNHSELIFSTMLIMIERFGISNRIWVHSPPLSIISQTQKKSNWAANCIEPMGAQFPSSTSRLWSRSTVAAATTALTLTRRHRNTLPSVQVLDYKALIKITSLRQPFWQSHFSSFFLLCIFLFRISIESR